MVPLALSLTLLQTGDPADAALTDELRLQGVEVLARPAPEGFVAAPLAVQLDAARLDPGAAVGWLLVDPDGWHAHVAWVEDERAVLRVVDGSAEGVDRLALAVREVLAAGLGRVEPLSALVVAPDPVEDRAPARLAWGAAVVGAWAPTPESGGARVGVEGFLGSGVGVVLGAALGDGQVRGSGAAFARWRWVRAALGVDVVSLPWVVWAQPRGELGASVGFGQAFIEPRVRLTPLRDRVEDGDRVRYDSGWVELAIAIGWRQIPTPP